MKLTCTVGSGFMRENRESVFSLDYSMCMRDFISTTT